MTAIDRLIATAEAEIGYLEKKSNKDLDDKTANAGKGNYTKYNRDLKAWTGVGSLNAQWCQAFTDWCFIAAFGLEAAKKLIYTFTNYTPTGSNAFKKKGRYIARGKGKPKRGDVIYFYSEEKGRIGHVGIVYKVGTSNVYTIEGNTSGANTLVENGGGVKKKSYKLTSTYIDGYGSVDYSQIGEDPAPAPEPVKPEGVKYGDTGSAVRDMQEKLVRLGYKLPKYGVDGDFGDETLAALEKFQIDAGLKVTGVYDADTQAAVAKRLDGRQYVEVTGQTVNVRSAPSAATGRILGIVKLGDRLTYGGQDSPEGWHLVEYKGGNGWISGKYSKVVN